MRVGQEYRVVPVGLRNGVFHPKCIYLASDDEQLLLVGSGNVTFGGHGRNAEVFEALVPDEHATAFADFAEFLETLGSSPDIQIARREWIDDFAGRATESAVSGGDKTEAPIRLIHPLKRTAIEQLAETAAGIGSCSEVKVISPYHDPSGDAVHALLETLKADSGVVAVTTDKSSPFPFANASKWASPISPQKPKIDGKRFVHAKWIEYVCEDERIVLTGSFNATSKALNSTENVELGVLRRMGADTTLLEWESCDAPKFEPAKPLPSGLGQVEIVYATLDRHNPQKLSGQLISLLDASGVWNYRVVQADGVSQTGSVTLDDSGAFAIIDAILETMSELPALQIMLQKDEREARGWIHNEMLLSVGARRRLTAGALSRLMRREGSDDDIQALLDYLSVAADKHLRVFSLPVLENSDASDAIDDPGQQQTVRVNLEDLAPLPVLTEGVGVSGSFGPSMDDQFETALVRLRRMLLGHGVSRSRASREGLSSSVLAEDEEDENRRQTPEQIAYSLGLQHFESAISEMIDACEDNTVSLSGLLTMQLEIGMWMRLHRLEDTDGAFEFLGTWIRRAALRITAGQDKVTALSQHFVTGTAIRAALLSGDHASDQLVGLHDDLEKFFGGSVDQLFAESALIADIERGFASALVQSHDSLDLHDALSEVLATRTRRQQLADALQLRAQGQDVPENWAVFGSKTGKKLYSSMHRPNWEKRIKKAIPNYEACSFCYCVYPVQEKACFHSERIGRCLQCHKYSLDLEA